MNNTTKTYDVFVVGGGINGCGIARDAAGRGYSVFLAEMNDFASGTSSWSTKLVHGGLRYLEHYEFRLVRESLKEREVLWAAAPHIIRPLRFVLPHHSGLRPAWLLRLGLFIYDHLGGRKALPPTRVLDMLKDTAAKPLKPMFKKAFEYSDCWVDDARLVVLNARAAVDLGAVVRTRTRVTDAERKDGVWHISIRNESTGSTDVIQARAVVNAAGPWVDSVLGCVGPKRNVRNVRMVQGSHIVVNKLFDHDRCYIFQNADGRIIFAIPYETDFTLIGTTDKDFVGDPAEAEISPEETDYLCKAASEYFAKPVTKSDVVWTYSGVRPLFDDGASAAQEATRDYVLRTEGDGDSGFLVNIFGGKITTYRRLAESVLATLEKALGATGNPWTAGATLPGGEFPMKGYDDQVAKLREAHPYLEDRHARRLVRLYGTRTDGLLADVNTPEGLGQHFGFDLYEAEVRYLIDHEWVCSAEDLLWRRTKLGLRLSKEESQEVARFIEKQLASHQAA